MVARLEDGKMIPCPKQGRDGRGGLRMDLPRYYKTNPHRAAEDGFYPVRLTRRPAGECAMSWMLRDGEIVQVWAPRKPQPDDAILAQIGQIEACLRRIRETVCA